MEAESNGTMTATAPGELTPEVVKAALQAARDTGKSQSALAREAGVSGTTLSQWLNGRYPGNDEQVFAKLSAWWRNRQAAAAAPAPAAATGWVETPTGRAIAAALLFAQDKGSIAVVYGGAGLGKTTATRHYAQANPNVWRVTATPSSAGLMATLEAVAAALGLRDISNRPSVYAREIVQRMTGTRGLLVVDEAQHVSVQALEELRSLHDASGVGLALLGNEAVYARLTGGNRQATFAQLFSRIGFRMHLVEPTRADTDAILTSWGIVGEKERDWAYSVGRLPGGLRGLTHTLRQAGMLAHSSERAIDVRALQLAWQNLGG